MNWLKAIAIIALCTSSFFGGMFIEKYLVYKRLIKRRLGTINLYGIKLKRGQGNGKHNERG
jgi:hypothetical protein